MKYSSKDYELIDNTALQVRLDYGYLEKTLDVFSLAKDLNMILIKYSSLTKEQLNQIKGYEETKDGFTIMRTVNGELKFYTCYNDNVGAYRIRFTIAHEKKHVVFLEKEPTDKQEDLANHFARYILAPTCLVMQYFGKLPEDIMFDFDISYEAATNALSAAESRILCNCDKLSSVEKEFVGKVK